MPERIHQTRKKVDGDQGNSLAQRQPVAKTQLQSQPQGIQFAQEESTRMTPEFADQRRQTRQLKAYGQMMQSSPRAVQLRAMQNLMSKPVLQKAEDEEPLQEKSANEGAAQLVAQANPQPVPKPNNTGLPNQLKTGIESLSGMSLDHVKVNYNSDKPAQLNAHAYAQGSEIHVAPGQEQHLPHEAWHVVQQAQGRVRPTMQMKLGVPVNDDAGLETEADVMGAKALQAGTGMGRQISQRMVLDAKEGMGLANPQVSQQLSVSDNPSMPIQRYTTKRVGEVLHVYFNAQLLGNFTLRTCGLTLNMLSETRIRNVMTDDESTPAILVAECLFRDGGDPIVMAPGIIFHFGNLLTYESGKSHFVNLGAIKYPGKPQTDNVESEINRFIIEDLGNVDYAKNVKSLVLSKIEEKEISLQEGKIELIRDIISRFIFESEDDAGHAFASKFASLPILSSKSRYGYLLNLALNFGCTKLAGLFLATGVPLNTVEHGESVFVCAAKNRKNQEIVQFLLGNGFHLSELIGRKDIAPIFKTMARCEVLGPNIQNYESVVASVLERSYVDFIKIDQETTPDNLKNQIAIVLAGKINAYRIFLSKCVTEGSDLVQADMEQICQSMLPFFELDERSAIKFYAHLYDAKGIIEGEMVNLEGMPADHAILQYALGIMSSINKNTSLASALLPMLIHVLKALERSIDVRFINTCFGDFDTVPKMIGHMLPRMRSEVSEGQGLLISGGWDAPEGERTGHSLYLTVPKAAPKALIHNRGEGNKKHAKSYGTMNVYPYLVNMEERDLFAWISKLLVDGIKGNKGGVLEKLYQDDPLESSTKLTPQSGQLVGNCSVANLENALLGLLELQYPEDGVKIFNYLQKSVRMYAESQVPQKLLIATSSSSIITISGSVKEANLEKLKKAFFEKDDGFEIVKLVESGAEPVLAIFKEKQTWLCLALLLKADKFDALAALKKAGVPAKEILVEEIKTLFPRPPLVIMNVLAFFYPD